ncbi:AraC family transcriptional regulator [Streptomyces sp. NPDC054849]
MSDVIAGARQDPPNKGLLFRGSNVDELHELITTRFSPHRLSVLDDHPLDGRFRCTHEGSVGLYELGYGAEVAITPEVALDFYNVHVPVAGGGAVTVNGETLSSPLSIVGPGHGISMRWNEECVNQVLIIPREVIHSAVAARLGHVPQTPLSFSPVLDGRVGAVKDWLNVVRHFAAFADSDLAARSPLALGHFEQLLVNGLLDAQPHALGDALAGGGAASLPGPVRRAADFCTEHAHEPISVTDIAQAARVGVRSLRDGFRTHLGTTPLAYLRRVRLDLARRDLLAIADGRELGTVTDVALRWGFTHLGRFTGYYREAYGETPSRTVRKPGEVKPCPQARARDIRKGRR